LPPTMAEATIDDDLDGLLDGLSPVSWVRAAGCRFTVSRSHPLPVLPQMPWLTLESLFSWRRNRHRGSNPVTPSTWPGSVRVFRT
jgi:hypothetical protein